MAIADILYTCIECGRQEGLRAADGAEVCERCGTRYSRVNGAQIRVERPGRPAETRPAAEWLDILLNAEPEPLDDIPPEPVSLRIAERWRPHSAGGRYLGRIEHFGKEITGTLLLEEDRLIFDGEEIRFTWPLLDLTAVQPSSRALQLKLRNGPLLSLKFPNGSAILWENRVQRAIQALFTQQGRGPILEFQPRIVTQ